MIYLNISDENQQLIIVISNYFNDLFEIRHNHCNYRLRYVHVVNANSYIPVDQDRNVHIHGHILFFSLNTCLLQVLK